MVLRLNESMLAELPLHYPTSVWGAARRGKKMKLNQMEKEAVGNSQVESLRCTDRIVNEWPENREMLLIIGRLKGVFIH